MWKHRKKLLKKRKSHKNVYVGMLGVVEKMKVVKFATSEIRSNWRFRKNNGPHNRREIGYNFEKKVSANRTLTQKTLGISNVFSRIFKRLVLFPQFLGCLSSENPRKFK